MSASPDLGAQNYYNNGHRAFLQAFMSRATMTYEDAKPILARLFSIQEHKEVLENDVTREDFTNMINTINNTLHPFDMEIRHTYPQNATTRSSDVAIYALVNLQSDPQTQLATSHSPDEIAYVKRVLDGIFETNNTQTREVMAIRGIDALNLARLPRNRDSAVAVNGDSTQSASGVKALTKDQAEKLLNSLVDENWLEKSRAGFYSLSPRALIELRDWLVETYNEPDEEQDEDEGPAWQRIKFCDACREVVTIGQRCSNRECMCRFHEFCTRQFFRNQTDRKCPTCKSDWTGENFVGERAARGAASRGSTTSRRDTREDTTMDDDDDSD